jgi:hypothetical protein
MISREAGWRRSCNVSRELKCEWRRGRKLDGSRSGGDIPFRTSRSSSAISEIIIHLLLRAFRTTPTIKVHHGAPRDGRDGRRWAGNGCCDGAAKANGEIRTTIDTIVTAVAGALTSYSCTDEISNGVLSHEDGTGWRYGIWSGRNVWPVHGEHAI